MESEDEDEDADAKGTDEGVVAAAGCSECASEVSGVCASTSDRSANASTRASRELKCLSMESRHSSERTTATVTAAAALSSGAAAVEPLPLLLLPSVEPGVWVSAFRILR